MGNSISKMKRIDDDMEEKDQLSGEYQGQKLQIIFSPDTIIEPFAVVVKQLNTTITFPTMK
jgi:hypothetical protein